MVLTTLYIFYLLYRLLRLIMFVFFLAHLSEYLTSEKSAYAPRYRYWGKACLTELLGSRNVQGARSLG